MEETPEGRNQLPKVSCTHSNLCPGGHCEKCVHTAETVSLEENRKAHGFVRGETEV